MHHLVLPKDSKQQNGFIYPTLGKHAVNKPDVSSRNRQIITEHLFWRAWFISNPPTLHRQRDLLERNRTWVAFTSWERSCGRPCSHQSSAAAVQWEAGGAAADLRLCFFFFFLVPSSAVGPTCACWGLSESTEDEGMFKSFRRTHKCLLDGLPLARRFLGRWRLDFFLFYCPHLKKKEDAEAPWATVCRPPSPPTTTTSTDSPTAPPSSSLYSAS